MTSDHRVRSSQVLLTVMVAEGVAIKAPMSEIFNQRHKTSWSKKLGRGVWERYALDQSLLSWISHVCKNKKAFLLENSL